MGIIGSLAVIAVGLAPFAGTVVINARKNCDFKKILLRSLLILTFPAVGLAITLFSKKLPPAKLSSIEKEAWSAKEHANELKNKLYGEEDKLEQMQQKENRPNRWQLQRQERKVENLKEKLQDQYLILGAARRKAEGTKESRMLPIYVSSLPDKSLRFELPCDLSKSRLNEMKLKISEDYGINIMDDTHIGISDKRSSDFNHFGISQDVLVYDTKTNKLNPFANEVGISDNALQTLVEAMKEFRKAVIVDPDNREIDYKEFEPQEPEPISEEPEIVIPEPQEIETEEEQEKKTPSIVDEDGIIGGYDDEEEDEAESETLNIDDNGIIDDGIVDENIINESIPEPELNENKETLNAKDYKLLDKDTKLYRDCLNLGPVGIREGVVGITMNGVTLAYAAAGPDGRIRMTGNGVHPDDKNGKRLAAMLNDKLKKCPDMESWIKKAATICLSPSNVQAACEGACRGQKEEKKKSRRIAMRNGILQAPKMAIEQTKHSIKL